MRSLRPLAVLSALLFSAGAARAEAWPTLEAFVQECVLIVKCKTELKENGARYRVLETWKGKYSPDLFYPRPPDGYLFTDTGHGNTNPTDGREVIFFFTQRNQPAFAKGKLVSHATCFVIAAGKVIYASTSMPQPGGLRKEYTVEGFKKAVAAVVEKETQRERDKPADSKPPTTRSRYNAALALLRASGVTNIAAALRHNAARALEAVALVMNPAPT